MDTRTGSWGRGVAEFPDPTSTVAYNWRADVDIVPAED
jgi:hypothetical protein